MTVTERSRGCWILAWVIGISLLTSLAAQSFSGCFDDAVSAVASARSRRHLASTSHRDDAFSCPLGDSAERRDCIANAMTTSVLPCFREATHLDLVHLLVPEIGESFVTELRNAAASYLDFSGNEIIVHTFPTDGILTEILSQFQNDDVFYTGWILPSMWLPFLDEEGPLLDITTNLTNDVAFDAMDVAEFYRTDMIMVDDSIKGIPISGDLILFYYRKDILDAHNISQPLTWEQVLVLAEQFNGTDLNDDGILDFGTCLVNYTGDGSRSRWIESIMAPYFQHFGRRQGVLFDPDDMHPLLENDAMAWVLDLYQQLATYGPYAHHQLTGISGADLFKSGRCLMTVGSADIFHQYGKGEGETMIGVGELPGSWYVFDRVTMSLVRCSSTLCPHGRADSDGNIINFAPYVGPLSLIGAVHGVAPKPSRTRLFSFLSYLGGKSLSFELVVDVDRMDSFRWSHLQVARWVDRGWNYAAALDYINAMSRSFVSGNTLWEPRVPAELRLDEALEEAGDRAVQSTDPTTQILSELASTLDSRIDAYGREAARRIYRMSLHLEPLEEIDGAAGGGSGGVDAWTLVLGLCLPLLVLSLCSMWWYQFHRGDASAKKRPAKPPPAGPQTSLVITDIQDSTTLWETLDADVMDEALQLHNQCLREVLRENNGYESATEGDAFIIAFHTAYDAVRFCYEAQAALMRVDWPEEILQASVYSSVLVDHEESALKHVTETLLARNGGQQTDLPVSDTQALDTVDLNAAAKEGESEEEHLVVESRTEIESTVLDTEPIEERYLFRGLRVRMGVYTGVHSPSDVMMNEASGRMMYSGISMALTKGISDVGCGGQIVISESTYKAMGLEKLLEGVHVFHLGEYHLSNNLPTTQFYEIVKKDLVSRLLHFPALKAQALSPAWFQAPSGVVCISFTFVVGAETLSQWNGKVFRTALHTYESLAKDWLQHYGGYQVEAADGLLLAAFSDPAHAIAWGLTLHEEMAKAEWPEELLSHPLCEKLSVHSVDHSGRVHLKDVVGLRLKTGIEKGPAKSNPHPTTGFMAYRGKVINRAARVTKLASGGQVYASRGVWEAAQDSATISDLGVEWRSMGTQKLKVRCEHPSMSNIWRLCGRGLWKQWMSIICS